MTKHKRLHGSATLDELAEELGITRERVRQIEVKALKKLRAQALNTPAMLPVLQDVFGVEFVEALYAQPLPDPPKPHRTQKYKSKLLRARKEMP